MDKLEIVDKAIRALDINNKIKIGCRDVIEQLDGKGNICVSGYFTFSGPLGTKEQWLYFKADLFEDRYSNLDLLPIAESTINKYIDDSKMTDETIATMKIIALLYYHQKELAGFWYHG